MITKRLRAVIVLLAVTVLIAGTVAAFRVHPLRAHLLAPVTLTQAEVARAQRYWLHEAEKTIVRAARPAFASIPSAPPLPPAPSPGTAQLTAYNLLPSYGFNQTTQFTCLVYLWDAESGWQWDATEPTSGAYGIPQALPGSKMASAGPDWQTDPATQIKWGLGYITSVYGSPCGAWAHEEADHWY